MDGKKRKRTDNYYLSSKLKDFGQMLVEPAVSDLMIKWFVSYLYDYGLQPNINGNKIEICIEYAMNWTYIETNILMVLWVLLKSQKINIIVDLERMNKLPSDLFEEFWNTMKNLSSTLVLEYYFEYERKPTLWIQ